MKAIGRSHPIQLKHSRQIGAGTHERALVDGRVLQYDQAREGYVRTGCKGGAAGILVEWFVGDEAIRGFGQGIDGNVNDVIEALYAIDVASSRSIDGAMKQGLLASSGFKPTGVLAGHFGPADRTKEIGSIDVTSGIIALRENLGRASPWCFLSRWVGYLTAQQIEATPISTLGNSESRGSCEGESAESEAEGLHTATMCGRWE